MAIHAKQATASNRISKNILNKQEKNKQQGMNKDTNKPSSLDSGKMPW